MLVGVGLIAGLSMVTGCGDDASGSGSSTTDAPATDATGGTADGGASTGDPSGPSDVTGVDDDPTTAGVTTQPDPVCGNGILESIEECDDGNLVEGDGCSSICRLDLDTSLWQDTHAGDAMVREAGHGIAVDSQGNVVVGGYEVDTVGDPNMWLAKYDPDGTQLWAMTMDPSGGLDDRIYGVAIDPDDHILLVGDADTAPASSDIWVAKLDPDGVEQWSTTFDGPDMGNDGGRGVASDSAGNVAITGFVRVDNNDIDIFVAKLDAATGATQWSEVVPGPAGLDDRGQAVGVDSTDAVVVGGFVSHGGFDRNVWVRKYDPDGVEQWTDEWDSFTMADDAGFGLTVAPDDSIVAAGTTPVIATNQDVWMGRWDAEGTLQWYKQFGGQDFTNDHGLAVAADLDANFIVVGFQGITNTDHDIWMRKVDVSGALVWSQSVVGMGMERDEANGVATDADGNIVVTGEIRDAPGNDGDVWVGKFGPG